MEALAVQKEAEELQRQRDEHSGAIVYHRRERRRVAIKLEELQAHADSLGLSLKIVGRKAKTKSHGRR